MAGRMQDKVVLITGATSGVGEAAARLFRAEGARVVQSEIDAADETQVEAQVEAAIGLAVTEYGRIDCMINHSDLVGAVGSIMETSAQAWRATQTGLLDSVFFGIKHGARQLRRQGGGGSILSLASNAGVMGGLGPHAFTAAMHGVVGLTRSAASELSQYGIRVNAVAPGSEQLPDDIAAGLLYLASDAAAHVTAYTLVIDGGTTAGGFASGASVLRDRPITFIGPSGGSTHG
ncbi:MAG: SDR family oxidoreductase [Pseudomonadota bacterium]